MRAAKFVPTQLLKLFSVLLGTLIVAAAMVMNTPRAYAQEDGIDLANQETTTQAHSNDAIVEDPALTVQGDNEKGGVVGINGDDGTSLTTQDDAQNYAVYNSADSNYNGEASLTFYYGTPSGTAGTDYYVGYDTAHYTSANQVPWHGKYSSTKHVVFDSTVQSNLKPSSTAYWFSDFSSLKDVTGLSYLDTSNVTDMNRMFCSCSALTSLNLSVLNTSNVTNMEKLLYGCWNLSSLTLGGSFSTANVTDMDNMFGACKALTTLDATQISTVAATSMSGMFSGCSKLTSLNLTGFNTSNVTDMTSMFSGCTNLATLTLGDNFSTSKISSMYAMFSACESLQTLTWPSNIDTSNITTMKQMFHGCKALKNPGLGNFNTANVTTFHQMFDMCTSLETLNLSNFSTAQADSLYYMFQGCTALETVTFGDAFDVAKVTTMNHMFEGCTSLKSLDLSKWNTTNITIMDSAFENCEALTTLDLSKWDFSNTYSMPNMLAGCKSLTSVNLGGTFAPGASLNKYSSCSLKGFFKGCTSFKNLDLTKWNTSKVGNMANLFYDCTALQSVNLSSFDTSGVKTFESMFSGCTALNSVKFGDKFNCKGDGSYSSYAWATLPTPSTTTTSPYYNGLWWKGSGTTSYKPNSEAMWSLTGSDIAGTWTWSTGIAVVATCSPSAGGTVSVSGTGSAGETVTLTAKPAAGYEFGGWTLTSGEGTLASTTDNPTSFTLGNANGTVKATFKARSYSYVIGSLSKASFTYNGSKQVPTVAVTDSSSSATLTAGTDYTVTYWQGSTQVASPTNTGTYTLRVTGAGNYASMGQADAGTFTIKQASIANAALALSKSSFTYNGSAQKPTVTKVGGKALASGSDYTLEYSNASSTNAGSYTVKAVGTGNYTGTSAAGTYKIAKAASSIKLANQTNTYTGKALAYTGAITKSGSSGAVSVAYCSDAACTKTIAASQVVNAGTYYVKATLAADANHNAATATTTLTVNPASQQITAKNCTASFKGKKSGKTKVLAKNMAVMLKTKAKVKAKTTVKYKKANKIGGKSIVVNAKTGKVTLKKGLKKGTYKVKVKLTAAKSKNYSAAKAKVITLTIKVK